MTVTELNDQIINIINKAELPFDAKVFVLRSIHTEMEQKYQEVIQTLKAQQEKSTETKKK